MSHGEFTAIFQRRFVPREFEPRGIRRPIAFAHYNKYPEKFSRSWHAYNDEDIRPEFSSGQQLLFLQDQLLRKNSGN